ncbi:MAG: xylulokinase, partial [Anaerolineae bacterium]
YGAAILAAVGTGAFASVEAACEQLIHVTGRTEVGEDTAVYNQIYPLYRQLYPALKPTFDAAAKLA